VDVVRLPRFESVVSRLRASGEAHDRLARRVARLEEAVEENRRLNQRLADVVDVVTELLVPAMDRDDERVKKALADLNKTLDTD
jgi:C4-dicarboxylate-specific signal transduction histidine kinase